MRYFAIIFSWSISLFSAIPICYGQKDSVDQELVQLLDSIFADPIQISHADSMKHAEVLNYFHRRDSIETIFSTYLESQLNDSKSSLYLATLAAKKLLKLKRHESLEFLVLNIGISRPNPHMTRPHDLDIYPCYLALFEASNMHHHISNVILDPYILNQFTVQPMVIGNTAYLLSRMFPRTDVCRIDGLLGDSRLTSQGKAVLIEIKKWMKNY